MYEARPQNNIGQGEAQVLPHVQQPRQNNDYLRLAVAQKHAEKRDKERRTSSLDNQLHRLPSLVGVHTNDLPVVQTFMKDFETKVGESVRNGTIEQDYPALHSQLGDLAVAVRSSQVKQQAQDKNLALAAQHDGKADTEVNPEGTKNLQNLMQPYDFTEYKGLEDVPKFVERNTQQVQATNATHFPIEKFNPTKFDKTLSAIASNRKSALEQGAPITDTRDENGNILLSKSANYDPTEYITQNYGASPAMQSFFTKQVRANPTAFGVKDVNNEEQVKKASLQAAIDRFEPIGRVKTQTITTRHIPGEGNVSLGGGATAKNGILYTYVPHEAETVTVQGKNLYDDLANRATKKEDKDGQKELAEFLDSHADNTALNYDDKKGEQLKPIAGLTDMQGNPVTAIVSKVSEFNGNKYLLATGVYRADGEALSYKLPLPYNANNKALLAGEIKNDDVFSTHNELKSGKKPIKQATTTKNTPTPANSALKLIKTKSEFDALPKGAKYTKIDGKTYTKG